jgi:hypothetical protein
VSATAGSRRSRNTLSLAWLLGTLALGCASPPPIAELTFVAFEPGVVEPRILQGNVEGEWCFSQNVVAVSLRPPWRARLADRGRAIAAAIESVPGANVLTDVHVRIRVEQYLLFQRTCAIVTGNAGRIE